MCKFEFRFHRKKTATFLWMVMILTYSSGWRTKKSRRLWDQPHHFLFFSKFSFNFGWKKFFRSIKLISIFRIFDCDFNIFKAEELSETARNQEDYETILIFSTFQSFPSTLVNRSHNIRQFNRLSWKKFTQKTLPFFSCKTYAYVICHMLNSLKVLHMISYWHVVKD